MNQKAVFDFINDVIFENAVKNNLDSETVKKSIAEYKKYLKDNCLADEETLGFIAKIEEKTAEYLELSKGFNEVGLKIPVHSMVTLQKEIKKKEIKKRKEIIWPSSVCDSGPIGGNC